MGKKRDIKKYPLCSRLEWNLIDNRVYSTEKNDFTIISNYFSTFINFYNTYAKYNSFIISKNRKIPIPKLCQVLHKGYN